LLPDTGEADAVRVALRLTEGVRGTPFPGEPALAVSVSLGVAMFPKDADTAEDLLACADRRNYLAKQRGRACAVADDAETDARPVSSRMLERDVPLTTVHDFLTRLRVEPRGALRVAGEPGAGHTRFLEAVALGAEPSLVLVDWIGERSAGLPARAQRELDRLTGNGHLVRAEHGALTIAPALLAKPKRHHQLPVPITELVGRQNETVQVAQLLAERRLVTLIGPAGIGKT